MHGFNRPLGPIGSNVVAPLQTTSSGMMVTANKIVPGQEAIDFKGYFKVESFPHNSVIYRYGDTTDRVYLLKSGRVRLSSGSSPLTVSRRTSALYLSLRSPSRGCLTAPVIASPRRRP